MPVALRRSAALFAGVMMLVLLLAESGFACAMPAMSSPASAGVAMRLPWAPSGSSVPLHNEIGGDQAPRTPLGALFV